MLDEIKKLVELGIVKEETAKKAQECKVEFEEKGGSIFGTVDGIRTIIDRKAYACECGKTNGTSFCEHILATAIEAGKLKNIIAGRAYPGGYWGRMLIDSGIVSDNIVRGAFEIIENKQIVVTKNLEGVYEGEIITENGTKIYTKADATRKKTACSRCGRLCRHIIATLLETKDKGILELAAKGELERVDYYQEEEKVIEGRIVRYNRYTRGYLLQVGDESFWVNGYIQDGQPDDEVKLKILEKGKSRKILEVLEHRKAGEVPPAQEEAGEKESVSTTTAPTVTETVTEEKASDTGRGVVVIGQDVVEQGRKVAEFLDDLDEKMMSAEFVIGAPFLVYEVPSWKCPKCGVLRATPYCDKCKKKIPDTEYYPRKQLTWEGISEAVHVQGNLRVVNAELREETVNINGRTRTLVYAYVEVEDVERNTLVFGVSDRADPTKNFYVVNLFSKAERNAFRKALRKETVDKVIKYAEEIGAVYRADLNNMG